MTNHILCLPRFDKYYFLLFEFLAGKKFQIHKVWYQQSDLMSGHQHLYLQVTIYFPIDNLHKYLLDNVSDKERKEYGEPSHTPWIKKVPRQYIRRRKSLDTNVITLID